MDPRLQVRLKPSNVRMYNQGEKFLQTQVFWLIKNGVNVPTNSKFDPLVVDIDLFGELPVDVRKNLVSTWLLTSTLVAKGQDGMPLGEKIGSDYGVLIIPKPFQKELGVGIELTRDNFDIKQRVDGSGATIELTEKDVIALGLVRSCTYGKANESSLWVPVQNVPDGKKWVKRFFNAPKRAMFSLVGRVYYYDPSRGINLTWEPSSMMRVLEESASEDTQATSSPRTLTDYEAVQEVLETDLRVRKTVADGRIPDLRDIAVLARAEADKIMEIGGNEFANIWSLINRILNGEF